MRFEKLFTNIILVGAYQNNKIVSAKYRNL